MNDYNCVDVVTFEWFAKKNIPAKTWSSHIVKKASSCGLDMNTKRPLIGPGEHVTRPQVAAAG